LTLITENELISFGAQSGSIIVEQCGDDLNAEPSAENLRDSKEILGYCYELTDNLME